MEIKVKIRETTTEDDIDSILLELDNMNADIDWVFVGDMSVKDKLIDFSKKYGIRWEYIPQHI